MAKTWYPVIDYSLCIECATCVSKCPHGVYDTSKAPTPVVTNPNECVDHCHGCGNRCPVGAITYVGDDTGWIPPNGKLEKAEPCCSCGSAEIVEKKALIEYLYLDLNTCERCIGTDSVLDEVMITLTPTLKLAGFVVEYTKTEIKTAELAMKYRFLSSPTIRVNGNDICGAIKENSCGCCSEISGNDVNCRVFEYNGETYEVPPKAMLAEAILKSIFDQSSSGCSCGNYELPSKNAFKFSGSSEIPHEQPLLD